MAQIRRPVLKLQPLLLAAGFLILIAISVGTFMLVNQARDDANLLAHTLTMQDKLSNVLLNVRRAESGQRGYLFTSDTAYLNEVAAAEPDTNTGIAELRALAQDNPARLAELDLIARDVAAKFAEIQQAITLTAMGKREEARAEVRTGRGRELMTSIRNRVEASVADESRLLRLRTDQSNRTNNLLLALTLAGAGLIVSIGALSVVLVQRTVRQAEAARKELAVTNANLEEIVAFRTADLTEANEEIQRFAYIVSHDLRSPLVNIMGFTSELEALRQDIFQQVEKLKADLAALSPPAAEGDAAPIEQLGQDFDEAIRFIKTSIGNMDRLINAVLKLSREGRRRFSPEIVDVAGLMDAIVQNVAHRATELGAAVTVGTLPPVESDRLALEQIFANLVDNALKYGRTEEPLKIDISGRINGNAAVYDITDNGRGIDPRDHQRVFELFRRSGTQDKPGEGIGLAHVRALVRRLGGTMGLTSVLGQGSTFTVTLPQRWSIEKRTAA